MTAGGRREWLLAGGSVVVFLLLLGGAEGVARLFEARVVEAEARHGDLGQLHRYSQTLGWEPRPGFRGLLSGRQVTIDRHGLRGRGHPLRTPHGRERVLVAGDSIAFGLDVGDHQTFATLLGAKRPGREVLNLAVQGYGTDQALLRVGELGLSFEPDTVVLAFCEANDFFDNALEAFLYDGRHPKPRFELVGGELRLRDAHLRLGLAARAATTLRRRSALYRLVAGRLAPPPAEPHWMRTVLELERRWPPLVRLAARLIGRLRERSEQAGADLLVALFPYHRSWEEGSERLAFLKRLLREEERVAFVDMAQRFRERGLRFEELTIDKLGHLSVRGHAAAAQILHDELVRDGQEGHRDTEAQSRPGAS